jgi:hypothetical protein
MGLQGIGTKMASKRKVGRSRDRNRNNLEMERAEEDLEEARKARIKAERVAAKLEKDRRQNHYADMVRRALWEQR